MYLKRLDIQGFKSFPERTTLLFDKGITSIVGPNGCGKSNIADSIRWVLGEQSMKAIRGSKLEDVIFTGTEFRKPLGFAEVSLTLDNSDKILPLEFSEITVTRRIFRSGESEYFINKAPCRLKDINNLFLDTGVGRDGYSIIGQGRIDEILSARSEDKRHIFEEASGIMKYRVRKEEAGKKLELTKQNILRIEDILNELEFQLIPLKEQAETAKKYLFLRDKLKELEINVYIDTIAKLRERIRKSEEEYNTVFENKNKLIAEAEQVNKENIEKSRLLKRLEENLDASRKEYYTLEANYEKALGEINLNNEKINNLKESIAKICNETSQLEQKLSNIQKNTKDYENNLEELKLKYTEALSNLEMKEKSLEEMACALNESENQLETMKAKLMEKLDLLSDKKLQVGNIRSHIENIGIRKKSINCEVDRITQDIEKEKSKKAVLEERINDLMDEIEENKLSLNSLIELKRKLDKDLVTEKEKRDFIKSEIQIKTSRYKMLKEMEDKLEGYNKTVKNFLQSCKKMPSLWNGIRGALGQLISVDKKYETAIEIALGSAIQNIVTDTEEDAKAAIEFLKENNLGRATFLPMTSVKGKYMEQGIINEAEKMQGFLGIGSDVVTCDSKYESIILSLLGKVAVVENLDTGIALAKRFKYAFRIVTLDGDILATSGAISGGSKDTYSHGLLSRAREILELKEDTDKLEVNLSTVENNINLIQNDVDNTSKKIQSIQTTLKEKEMDKLRCESQLSHINENIKNRNAKREMLKEEYAQISRQEEEINQELKKYENEQQKIENEIIQLKESIDKHQEVQRKNLSERDVILAEITNYKISVNSYKESIDNVKKNIQSLIEEKGEIGNRISCKNHEKEKAEKEIELIKESNLGLENSIKAYNEQKTGKSIEIDRIIEERKAIEEELGKTAQLLEDIRKNVVLLNEELSRLNIKKAKDESELEAVQNRMWDEYELTYTNALEFKKDIGSMAKAQKEINEYKNRIKELGYININAIDEYIKTKERFDFITAQKADMEDSVEKLKRIIHEIDVQMKEQFIENFNLINTNFNMVFKELFGGGTANLRLVDKDNVLESGIEIEAQPPGKRLQNMMLLSGGERAFTAIALLFSILLLKPVSFCVLDEIEASLDEANVSRFALYIKKLSSRTQFIVITHKKSTMEVSDAIYGVTMQEKGISKVVSMKINEKNDSEKVG
ncbi:MAG: chromosome segregation protein SMC [Firmicutes bacterium]|nr:chromosome segregation protein SMC [Bacillota bacterium]